LWKENADCPSTKFADDLNALAIPATNHVRNALLAGPGTDLSFEYSAELRDLGAI
jgi:hypothetical protein